VRFTTTRLRPGYDEHEVDAALERYQAELAALDADLDMTPAAPTRCPAG